MARKTRGKSRRKRLTPRWLFVLGFGRKLNATGCPERRRTGPRFHTTEPVLGRECNYRGYRNYDDGANINAEQRTLFRAA